MGNKSTENLTEERIFDIVEYHFDTSVNGSKNAAKEIYSLVQPLQEENKRLGGLIKKAFEVDYYPDGDIEKAWDNFKTQNHIA